MKKGFLGFKNKKGNAVMDAIMVIVVLFVFTMMIFFGSKLFHELDEDIQSDDDISEIAKTTSKNMNDRYDSFFDGLFLFLLILLWILVLVASFMVDAHPIFFAVTIILMIFVFVVGAFMGQAYEEFVLDDDIIDVIPGFPITHWIMSHFLITLIVIGFSIVIVLFGKSRVG